MTDVEAIKIAIAKLPPRDRAELRVWYEQFESDAWDQQIAADVQAGHLDRLADEAIKAFQAGTCTEL